MLGPSTRKFCRTTRTPKSSRPMKRTVCRTSTTNLRVVLPRVSDNSSGAAWSIPTAEYRLRLPDVQITHVDPPGECNAARRVGVFLNLYPRGRRLQSTRLGHGSSAGENAGPF